MAFRIITASVALLVSSGCAGRGELSVQVINTPLIEKAQAEIKREIGVYFARSYARRQFQRPNKAAWCGDGSIDYDVVSVKVDLLTTQDTSSSSKAGLKLPVLGGVGALRPSASITKTVTNTQQLTYMQYMLDDRFQPSELRVPPSVGSKPSPIADLMLSQREALVNAAVRSLHPGVQPCFSNFDPANPEKAQNTLVMAIEFVDDRNGGLDVDLGLVSFGASSEQKGTFSNTVTVSYRQRGLSKTSVIGDCPGERGTACVLEPVAPPTQVGIGIVKGAPPPAAVEPGRCRVVGRIGILTTCSATQ